MSGSNSESKPLPALCAGQDCHDRKRCARFRLRGWGVKYASFDIERLYFEGDCPSFEEFRFKVVKVQHRTG